MSERVTMSGARFYARTDIEILSCLHGKAILHESYWDGKNPVRIEVDEAWKAYLAALQL